MSIEVAFVLRNEAATFTSKLFLLIAVENVCVGLLIIFCGDFVKTPTTTSIRLNTTTIDVGFDMIMTVHHPTPPTTQELYSSSGEAAE